MNDDKKVLIRRAELGIEKAEEAEDKPFLCELWANSVAYNCELLICNKGGLENNPEVLKIRERLKILAKKVGDSVIIGRVPSTQHIADKHIWEDGTATPCEYYLKALKKNY